MVKNLHCKYKWTVFMKKRSHKWNKTNKIKQKKKTNQKNTQICTPSMNQVTQSLVDRGFLLNL